MSAPQFKNAYLSFSRLKRFESCPLSFKLHYIDRLKSAPGDPLKFGSLLHTVLENVYQWVIDEEYAGRLDEERALALYRSEWGKSGLAGLGLFQEGLAILNSYISENAMVDHRDILAVEQEFRLPVGDFEVLGYIDRVDRIDDETVEIIDYKSNRLLFTRDEVANDLQLSLYHMAAQQLWPWAKNIRLAFHMLRHSVKMQTERTEEQIDAAKQYIVSLARQTEGASTYAPQLNPNCQYCDHRQHCPAYQDAVAGKVEVLKSSKEDLESVAREREQVANLAKILYARKSELERILKAKLKDEDTLELAGMVYRMSHSAQLTYPVEPTLQVITELTDLDETDARDRLLVIDKSRVDALLKKLAKEMERPDHRMLKARLATIAKKKFSPRLYAKKEVRS